MCSHDLKVIHFGLGESSPNGRELRLFVIHIYIHNYLHIDIDIHIRLMYVCYKYIFSTDLGKLYKKQQKMLYHGN